MLSPKRDSPFNHVPLSAKKPNQLSANKMGNRLLQLAEVRKKSALIEVPKPHKAFTIDELVEKKTAMWKQISFIMRENRCVGKNEDFVALLNLIVEYSKITPVQVCSAVKDAVEKGYYLSNDDVLVNPNEESYSNPAPEPSAPPSNNNSNSPRLGGTRGKKMRKQRKTRRLIN
jgi:hypothetical protein